LESSKVDHGTPYTMKGLLQGFATLDSFAVKNPALKDYGTPLYPKGSAIPEE